MKTKTYVLLPALFVTSLLSAQVDLEITDGILVETIGGLEIQVSGDVVESGNGYLNGVVTSGERSAVTQFAGLTLSSPFDGKITRTTGKMYPSAGANLTRYYEVYNQEDSDLIANVITVTTTAELGSLTGPFFHYTKNGNSWKGYGFGSLGTTVVSNDVLFPQNSVTDLIISEGVGVKAKIFLEGPYNAANHNMNNSINNIISLKSPYSADERIASNKPSTAVDWVLVQLRDQTSPSTVIASRSAFLNSDGNLIDDNATLGIGIAAPAGDYYITIKHRNHLPVMSANTVSPENGVYFYNFTDMQSRAYTLGSQDGMVSFSDGKFGMMAGDIDQDKEITTTDYTIWFNDAITASSGYLSSDCNLDGEVTTSDYALWFNNAIVGTFSSVP
jgi:hypothetical protein